MTRIYEDYDPASPTLNVLSASPRSGSASNICTIALYHTCAPDGGFVVKAIYNPPKPNCPLRWDYVQTLIRSYGVVKPPLATIFGLDPAFMHSGLLQIQHRLPICPSLQSGINISTESFSHQHLHLNMLPSCVDIYFFIAITNIVQSLAALSTSIDCFFDIHLLFRS